MELVSDYMRDDTLRHALNDLTRKTFGFDFEDWVTGGYFEGDYIPYSFIENGKIISNVSANRMTFLQNGIDRNYIQIGTVMTDEAYRRHGLAKKLMEHVVKQYKDSCDGFYLFANPDAVDFYNRCGFSKETEYRYSVKNEFCMRKSAGEIFMPVNTADEQMKQKYMDMVRRSAVNSSLEQLNKFGLQMFYSADMENVYYAKDMDCFIVAEMEENTLLLQSVICENHVTLLDVLQRVKGEYHNCQLGFTPALKDMDICVAEQYDGADDYRLFYLGEQLKSIENEKLYFPELSHA
ncbi:MAG: GNAT family N-acetyltransferase [Lachnospiraceae bacterium]|nr:GNAT family N-acetyltransferase [Lachnospiraceae bacterium]